MNEPRTLTEAQINANRENAKKSTGPRSAQGKAASSRNRLLHGLRANKHILLDEDPEDFLILLKDLDDRFRPVGEGEEMLVTRIAADQWRLDRTLPIEAGIYRQRLEGVAATDYLRRQALVNHKRNHELEPGIVPPPPAPPDEGDRLARAFNIDCDGPNYLANLNRYKSSIERSIDRCLRQLKTYQAARTASTLDVAHAVPPAEPDPPVAEPPVPPAEPAATPSNSGDYHSNPKNGGIAQFGVPSGSAAMLLMVYALLHAVPEFIAALASLLTGPRTFHNRPKMNIFHPVSRADLQVCASAADARRRAKLVPCHAVIP